MIKSPHGDKPYRKDTAMKNCRHAKPNDQYGSPQEIANAVHYYVDWLRAVDKRTWDNRPPNHPLKVLELCQKGKIVNEYNPLHYDEDETRP